MSEILTQLSVSWDDVAGLSEAAAYELVRGRLRDQLAGFAEIGFSKVQREMERDRTMTLTLLWEEYAMLAARNGEKAYGYSRFCELYSAWCDDHDTAADIIKPFSNNLIDFPNCMYR